jgi:hypothetical protein
VADGAADESNMRRTKYKESSRPTESGAVSRGLRANTTANGSFEGCKWSNFHYGMRQLLFLSTCMHRSNWRADIGRLFANTFSAKGLAEV